MLNTASLQTKCSGRPMSIHVRRHSKFMHRRRQFGFDAPRTPGQVTCPCARCNIASSVDTPRYSGVARRWKPNIASWP
jgi:hypothetical protein